MIAIRDADTAAVLIGHPIRQRILAEAREPVSAAELAGRLGAPRQRLNYHVRLLAKSGLLRPAGRRRRRNMEEHRYTATARAYVLSPELLESLEARPEAIADGFSAAYLQALTSRAQRELAAVTAAASDAGVRLLTLSLDSALRFESAAQRAAFGRALTDAVALVVAEHTSPSTTEAGAPGTDRAYRLIVGCYPIPPGEA
ncbi:MAG TPA: helix-turn-helix domain-containing protein [Longimicrobiales bacterium]|nr:helix-turn-helix domain-containing protein [Longimicrobiales bacterium]